MMLRCLLALTLTLTLTLGAMAPAPVRAQSPLDLEFLPPTIVPRDLCLPGETAPGLDDLTTRGDDEELTDPDRIRFLTRDIRRHADADADGLFDFIDALITWRARIDGDFAGIEEVLTRIDLHLRAGRIDALTARGLVPALYALEPQMTNAQRMALAQYYLNGLGVARDPATAQTLIREAAFGGHPRALLEIARQQQAGKLVDGWDAPLDLTVTMAFGGILGELSPGICARAERIAREYLRGEIVARNPAIALAWRRFAADLGSAEAAWRVVEHHLNAPADRMDNDEMRRYLRRAADLGLRLDSRQTSRIMSSGAVSADELQALLGDNLAQDARRTDRSIVPYLELVVNIDGLEADEDGLYLDYLHEVAALPEAPGLAYRELANELRIRKGRWAAEAESRRLLEEAVRRGDPLAMQDLARLLTRYRDDPRAVARVEALLFEATERYGLASAMDALHGLYRCQLPNAPHLAEAAHWGQMYRATSHALVPISATDLIALDPFKDPETIAKIQTQALTGRVQAAADHAQRVQSARFASDSARRYWAERINRSDQRLEAFAELEFELATTPAERALAVEFFRRVYLNNGVTTALDLAIALTEDNARDPDVAREILHLLTMAGNRGEGAAIRLKSRLLAGSLSAEAYAASGQAVYREFADVIEARGDFLALMFAIPYLPADKVEDYIDRAVSLMNCGTKDAEELGDAHALRDQMALSFQWRQIGLSFEGGHVLSKLRLSNAQMAWFDDGAAPDATALDLRAEGDGDALAPRRRFVLLADADLPSYDPEAAAEVMAGVLAGGGDEAMLWAFRQYHLAEPALRLVLEARLDLTDLLTQAARLGAAEAQYILAMRQRDRATDRIDLAAALDWLARAAEQGHVAAMVEYGFALGFGLGVEADPAAALAWVDRAALAGHPRAEALAALLRARAAP